MAFLESLDPVTLVNLILSLTIVAVAVWGYFKLKNVTPLYIGAAYVLFSTSHAILLFKITWVPQNLLILIRLAGYFLVIFGLYAILKLVMELKEAQTTSESSKADSPLVQNLPRIAEYCGLVVIVFTLIFLGLQTLVLLSFMGMPGFLVMSEGQPVIPGPLVLALFLVLGICLFVIRRWKEERWSLPLTSVLAGIVLILSLLFIVSTLLWGAQGGSVVLHGDMIGGFDLVIRSLVTVIGLGLAAFVLLTVRFPDPRMRDTSAVLSALIFVIGAFTLVGYAYQSPVLTGGATNPVTMGSAALFMILGTGLLAYIGTGSRFLSQALDNSIQSQMMRGLIPVMVMAVLIEGWICIVVLPALTNVINPALMSAGIAVLSIVAISFVIAIQAGQISAVITRAERERQKAEEQKQKSQALFKTMFESSADAIWTMSNDIIVDCNRTAEVMFGTTRDKINGKSVLALSPERQPDGQMSAQKAQGLVAAALEGNPQFFEWIHTRVDGTPFPAEITLNRVKCAKKFYLQASIRDITQRKKAEEELNAAYSQIAAAEEELRHQYTALAETEEMFRNPVEHSPVGVYLQQDGIIRYANPHFAEMFGYTRDEVLDKQFMALVDPDNNSVVCTLSGEQGHTDTGQCSQRIEFMSRKKDGTPIDLEIFEAPMEFKERPAFYGTLVDITDRKKAEAAVKESEDKLRFQNLELEASNEEVRSIAKTLQNNLDELLLSQKALRESEDKLRLQNLDLEASNEEIRAISETLQNNYDELAKSQKALAENEEKYRSLVDNISVAVYRNNVESPSRWLWVNPAFCKILGYESPDEALSHPVSDIYYTPEDRLPFLSALNTVGFVKNFEIILKKKNGAPIWVSLSAQVKKNPDGTIAWVDGIGEDITERKRAEMAIRESEEKVRSILESAAEAIYGIDKDGNCTFYNPSCARLTGFTKPDELLGKNIHTLIHHSHPDGSPLPTEQCRVAMALQEGKGIHLDDEVFWRADGTSFPVEVWSYPQVKDGVVTGMVVTFFDITERKKMEAAIKTNLGEKEMLLKEIHHRVKNNMQVISSLLQLQSQSLKDEGTKMLFRESMGRIKSIALVHEQLYRSDNLSQIEYGGYLRKMFGPLFESYKADARRIAMVIEADNVMVTIEKAVPCSLIVNEMMSNSLKYAFPGDKKGEIRINFALDESKENYILDYSDNGIGLPEGFVPGKTGSLGTTLINGLTKQLKGTLMMIPGGPGVHYVIKFPSQELRGK